MNVWEAKKKINGKHGEYLRCNLISRVSAHHVLNNQRAAGMLVEPSVESQDVVLENDNRVAVGNHAFDNTLREDLIAVHGREVWCRTEGIDRDLSCEGYISIVEK